MEGQTSFEIPVNSSIYKTGEQNVSESKNDAFTGETIFKEGSKINLDVVEYDVSNGFL